MSDYNGWTNYETWNVPLWIDNEEPSYRARRARKLELPGQKWTARTVEDFARELYPRGTPDFRRLGADGRWTDAGEGIGAKAFEEVNWQEIADAWNDE